MRADFYLRRVFILLFAFVASVILLTIRLYRLASGDNKALEVLSGQYTRSAVAAEHNGFVYDRNGELMSHVKNGVIAIVNPEGVLDKNRAVGYLSDNSEHSFDELLQRLEKGEPFTVNADSFPENGVPQGIYVYPSYAPSENSFCRHLLGYRNSDGEGVCGVYKSCAGILEGCTGSLLYKYTADATGAVLRDGTFYVEDRMYTDEKGVILTVDAELQKRVDDICEGTLDMGAVVISDIADGSLLALSSRPLYDADNVSSYLDSPNGELINRVFSLYTPGSVFKAVISAAALERDEGLYEFEYECTGECDVSGQTFKCHNREGHGVQNMKEAFANSCNTYFINLLKETGFEYTLAVASVMGLGKPHSIDGIYVEGANMPDALKKYPEAYKANFSFGQGELLVSCLDVLNVYSVCAYGYRRDFSLVKGIYEGTEEEVLFEKGASERILSENTVMKMREMMRFCVTDGTGREARVTGTEAGGKTATAQSGQYKKGSEMLHTWFAGVFPIDNPRYAVVVLCDGNGKSNASPKEIFALCAESVLEICDN